MKIRAPFIVLASFTLAFAGCTKQPQPQTASLLKTNDLGIIDVSSGKSSDHTLTDGRVCTITPTLLPDGNVRLATTTDVTTTEQTSGTSRIRTKLDFEAPVNKGTCIYMLDKNTLITLTLRK